MHKDILLFGMQCSGKWTQAKLLSDKYNFIHFETGARLRKKSLENDKQGLLIRKTINQGNLVSDKVIVDLLVEFLESIDNTKRVIFDWLIRTEKQLKSVLDILKKYKRKCVVLLIWFDRETALSRITYRKFCPKCGQIYKGNNKLKRCVVCWWLLEKREDDNKMTLNKRIDNYYEKTLPVIMFLKYENYPFFETDGRKKVEEVFSNIENWLKLLNIL